MFNILVVDDNKSIQKLMEAYLKRDGYHVLIASDGHEALDLIDEKHIDAMIVDVMMPHMDGYELTEALRNSKNVMPILMITAKETIADKKQGFLVGVDDYMVKPIDFDEMLLRVAALLRRAKISNEKKLVVGALEFDYDNLTVKTPKEIILLPQKEFYLLFKLLSYPQKIFTRYDLMDEIWGFETETNARTVDVHIKRLREKFNEYPDFKIVTIRGLGYKVEKMV